MDLPDGYGPPTEHDDLWYGQQLALADAGLPNAFSRPLRIPPPELNGQGTIEQAIAEVEKSREG